MRGYFSILIFFLAMANGFSQNPALAQNYFEQGEYEKALSIYQQLYEKNPNNTRYLQGMVSSYQELGNYEMAIKLLEQKVSRSSRHPDLLVELGYSHQLQRNLEAANENYVKAISKVTENPFYAYSVGEAFLRHNLLDQAAQTYETAMAQKPNTNFTIQLARIYGEQGKTEKMFVNYLKLIEENPNLFHTVNRFLGQYITDDPENEANQIFRKLLLKKLQEKPDVLYNQMLSWLFTQQKDFKNAFVQEKAISMRSGGDLKRIFDLVYVVRSAGELETAKKILNYLIEKSLTDDSKLSAYFVLLDIRTKNAPEEEYEEVRQEYLDLFALYGKGPKTMYLQIGYADFLAFKLGEKEQAKSILREFLSKEIGLFPEAKAKMKLADVLVLDEKFNQALIYYSQVQKLVKNDILAQEARYKVAQTSYYKGDFDWALTQLDVLKSSTSQLIANDAMELSLLIKDNSLEDSTQTALKRFAKADLYAFQKKNDQALSVLNGILENHKDESIIDEALFRKGQLLEEKGNYEEAKLAYQKIIAEHKEGILADNAYFALAELYRIQLDQPEKAMENYEQIIFNHQDSIYFVEARKRFRELRGDTVE
jgi:tetratricopeptide (TPR) repeat protein